MNVQNAEWRAEVDKKKEVKIYRAGSKKLVLTAQVDELICLTAIIDQIKGAVK